MCAVGRYRFVCAMGYIPTLSVPSSSALEHGRGRGRFAPGAARWCGCGRHALLEEHREEEEKRKIELGGRSQDARERREGRISPADCEIVFCWVAPTTHRPITGHGSTVALQMLRVDRPAVMQRGSTRWRQLPRHANVGSSELLFPSLLCESSPPFQPHHSARTPLRDRRPSVRAVARLLVFVLPA